MLPILSDAELVEITRRRQPAAQARVLDAWRVPYQRRPDGTLVVGRVAFDQAMGCAPTTRPRTSNGLNWSR